MGVRKGDGGRGASILVNTFVGGSYGEVGQGVEGCEPRPSAGPMDRALRQRVLLAGAAQPSSASPRKHRLVEDAAPLARPESSGEILELVTQVAAALGLEGPPRAQAPAGPGRVCRAREGRKPIAESPARGRQLRPRSAECLPRGQAQRRRCLPRLTLPALSSSSRAQGRIRLTSGVTQPMHQHGVYHT